MLKSLKQLVAEVRRRIRWLRRDTLPYWLALVQRRRLRHVTFIGVTGSCGKTTTAALTGAVLESAGPCCLGAGDNSLAAVVKNVLSVSDSTKFCLQEISGSRPGRIASHCKVLQPQIGIITTVGSDHFKNFRNLEATAQSKSRLVELLPSTGTAILNADDARVATMAERTSARVITFGSSPTADVRATQISGAWPNRLVLTVNYRDETAHIQTRLVGEHWTTSVLAAIACGLVCGIDLGHCVRAVESFEPLLGRYSVHVQPNGPIYIFDHKAPFWTIAAALEFIRSAQAPRKTMVLGTISDYPGSASGRYRRVARDALEVADRVAFVGPHSGHVRKMQQPETLNKLLTFETSYQASLYLAQHNLPGELIYIKGSIAVDHLERIFLSQLDRVVCWRERCRKGRPCVDCAQYRIAKPPPFRLVHDGQSVASTQVPYQEHSSALVAGGRSLC